jgi:quinoprotein glucose dehydrogenase
MRRSAGIPRRSLSPRVGWGLPFALLLLALVSARAPAAAGQVTPDTAEHQRGTQYSSLKQINRKNVADLERAWEYHTGDLPPAGFKGLMSFEDEPTLVAGNLIICSVKRRLTALDPASGKVRWTFDSKDPGTRYQKCRGISSWVDETAQPDTRCKTRLFLGTSDYRLIAIDAATGKPCGDFGRDGVVAMPASMPVLFPEEVAAGSNPAVINDVVVVGSAVADNQRVDAPSGRVLAYDARTGARRWEFDPVPRDAADPAMASWSKGTAGFGQANVWSSMAVDEKLDLVYLPTTSPSGDFYGAERPGDNRYTTSVVALKGSTGKVVWHQQLVHHNLWDYDIPARPMLIDYPYQGKIVAALVQNTKMGLVFVFDRATGEPLVPMVERAVPQKGAVAGEVLSPTQPFPDGMPSLMPLQFTPDDAWGFTYFDKKACREEIEQYDYGSIYTPISERGTIVNPSVGGGPNWGGGGYDPATNVMVVPTNRVPTIVKLIPLAAAKDIEAGATEASMSMNFRISGSPYVVQVMPLVSPLKAPCSAPPWAALTALDVVRKKIVWQVPLGSLKKMLPIPLDIHYGTPGAGGPLVTAGGLVFIGYTLDNTFRAFDLATGEVLWEADIPAAGAAVPVTYEVNGEQYVVITAGGHTMYKSTMGDAVVAYKLKQAKP